jgi:hypothetical protein
MINDVQSYHKQCSIKFCKNKVHAKGFCHNHYRESRRRLEGVKAQEKRPKICIVPECGRKHYCQNYCSSHYSRLQVSGDVKSNIPIKILFYGKDKCDVVFCNNKHKARGLCNTHDATKRTYNLSSDQLVEMLSRSCEICGTIDNLSIDHDHSCCKGRSSCGQCVRGTVCQNCNRSMGQAKDNPDILRKLANYLESYKKQMTVVKWSNNDYCF